MKMRLIIAAVSFLLLSPGTYAAAPADPSADSARSFVQAFYDWYMKLTDEQRDAAGADPVLSHKPAYLSSELAKALKADADASSKSPDEVVGLDFDPYLNSQDDCGPYTAGTVKQKGKVYEVEVTGSCADDKPGVPDVVPQLVKQGGSWIFVDFVYPAREGTPQLDLFSVLKRLRQERAKTPK
jgi:hypothetical protein